MVCLRVEGLEAREEQGIGVAADVAPDLPPVEHRLVPALNRSSCCFGLVRVERKRDVWMG